MKKQVGRFTIDTCITVATRILQLGLAVVLSVIIGRTLGPGGKGIYALALLLPRLLEAFANLGISQACIFHTGKGKYGVDKVLGNGLILGALLGVSASAVGLMIVLFAGGRLFPGVPNVYLCLALLIPPLHFLLNPVRNCLLGLHKVKEYNFTGAIHDVIFLGLIALLLLTSKLGVTGAIAAEVVAVVLTTVLALRLARRVVGCFRLRPDLPYMKEATTYGFKIYLANLTGFFHYRIDQFLLNILLLDPAAVGLYATAATISERIWLVSQSAGLVLFPRVSSESDPKRLKEFTPRVCRNVLLVTFAGALILCVLGRLLMVFLYSERFLGSVAPFRILLIGAVTLSGWRVLANDLCGRGKPELNIFISVFCVVVNVVLNVLWIPRFGIAGAAWASSISYTMAFIIGAIVYSRVSGNKVLDLILPKKSDFRFYASFTNKVFGSVVPRFARAEK